MTNYEIIKSGIDIKKLTEDFDKFDFVESTYYDSQKRKNIVNKEIRKSSKCAVNNQKLNQILTTLLEKHGYLFVPVGLELIRYNVNDFFVRHQDHSVGNNDSTFLLCIQSSIKGGETILDTTPIKQNIGDLLIFDKKISHEGYKVEEGTKIVLKGNCVKLDKKEFMVINVIKNNCYYIVDIDIIKKKKYSYKTIWKNHKQKNPESLCYLHNDFYRNKNDVEEIISKNSGPDYLSLGLQLWFLGRTLQSMNGKYLTRNIKKYDSDIESTSECREDIGPESESDYDEQLKDVGSDCGESSESEKDYGFSLFD